MNYEAKRENVAACGANVWVAWCFRRTRDDSHFKWCRNGISEGNLSVALAGTLYSVASDLTAVSCD